MVILLLGVERVASPPDSGFFLRTMDQSAEMSKRSRLTAVEGRNLRYA